MTDKLYSKYDYKDLKYEDLVADLYTFIYTPGTTQSRIRSQKDIDDIITTSKTTFTTTVEGLDDYQLENEKMLFNTFLYSARTLWENLLTVPDKVYDEVLEVFQIYPKIREPLANALQLGATANTTAAKSLYNIYKNTSSPIPEASIEQEMQTTLNTVTDQLDPLINPQLASTPVKYNSTLEKLFENLLKNPATNITELNTYITSILHKYLPPSAYEKNKTKAYALLKPGKALANKLSGYVTEPLNKTGDALEKLIKYWVPYRFMYYSVYNEDPHQIEDFKEKIKLFEVEKKMDDTNFDRMMLTFIQLIQMASINDDYRDAIIKEINTLFPGYTLDKGAAAKTGGTPPKLNYLNNPNYPSRSKTPLERVQYLTNAVASTTSRSKQQGIAYTNKHYAPLVLPQELKLMLRDLLVKLEKNLPTMSPAKQIVLTDVLYTALNEELASFPEKIENLLRAVEVASSSPGETIDIPDKLQNEVNKLVGMIDDSIKTVSALQAADAEAAAAEAKAKAAEALKTEVLDKINAFYKNIGSTTIIDVLPESITDNDLPTLNENLTLVNNFFDSIGGEEGKKLDMFYKLNTSINNSNQFKKENFDITTDVPTFQKNLEKLKSQIETYNKVRVVLSFNKAPDYFDQKIIDEIKNTQSPYKTAEGKQISPFYKYLDGRSDTLTTEIVNDVKNAKSGNKHYIYVGYGFSGSGKTYTLLDTKKNENSVLKTVVDQLNDDTEASLAVYELYGEDPDDTGSVYCKDKIKQQKVYYYNLNNLKNNDRNSEKYTFTIDLSSHNNYLKNNSSNLSTIQNIDTIITEIDTIRKRNFASDPTEFHIRSTPNNPDSSRSHLFYEFTIGTSKITIIDMGGTENVDDIEKQYFTIDKKIDTTELQRNLKRIVPIQLSQLIQVNNLNTIINSFIKNISATIAASKTRPVAEPNLPAWENLFNTLKDTTYFYKIQEYNAALTEYEKVLDKQVQDAIIDKFIPSKIKLSTEKPHIIQDKKTLLEKLNNNSNIKNILNKFYDDDLNRIPDINSTEQTFLREALVCYLLTSNLHKIISILSSRDKVNNILLTLQTIGAETYILPTEYIDSMNTIFKANLSNLTNEKITNNYNTTKEQFEEIITKYHCPLRRQGNYINRSITDLKNFALTLANQPTANQTKQTVLAKLLKPTANQTKPTALADLLKSSDITNTKLTVIAALRTDSDHTKDIDRTLYFAHCINPFSNKTDPYINCQHNMQGGAPQPAAPAQNTPPPGQEPLITPAKLKEDIDSVKGYLKKSYELKQSLADVKSTWDAYTGVTQPKAFKDLKISLLLDSLISEIKKDSTTGTTVNDVASAKQKNIFNYFSSTDTVDPKLHTYITVGTNNYYYNYAVTQGQPSSSDKNAFIEKRKTFANQLKELATALNNNTTVFPDKDKRNKIVEQLGNYIAANLIEYPLTTADVPEEITYLLTKIDNSTSLSHNGVNIFAIKEFLTNIKTAYDKIPGYTAEEIKGTNSYLQKSAEPLKKDLVDKLTKVSTEYSKLIDELTKQAKRYETFNPSIKNKVLLELEPKEGGISKVAALMERINFLIGRIKADIDINKSSFEKAAEGAKTSKSGGGYLLCDHAFLTQAGGAGDDEQRREEINELLTPTDKSGVYANINRFENLAKTFVKNLEKSSDPTFSLITKGNESLFNALFNKYSESKADTSKGEYVAAMELAEGLKANNLIPREVLKITYFDKTVFIFASLIMRLIALALVELLIDKNRVKKLSHTFLSYIGIYIGLFYVLLLIVNLDDYKLRILFNFINMHANASIAILHPAIVAVFGLIIYYVMVNINQGDGHTVAGDEDRARLKYKIQVISLVIWMFTSLLVLLI